MGFFDSLFGGSKKSSEILGEKYGGMRPYSSFEEAPTGKQLRKRIEDRLAGIDIGYDPNVLNAATAPYAQAERTQFEKYSMPTISATASARGLGRSTIPISQIRQGAQEVETSIGQKVAGLTLANEQQKSTDRQNALSMYYQYTKDDTAVRELAAKFDYADYVRNQGNELMANQLESQANNKIMQTIGGVVGGIGGFMVGGPAGAVAGFSIGSSIAGGGGSGMSGSDLSSYLSLLQTGGNASLVNTGATGANTLAAPPNYYLSSAARSGGLKGIPTG